MNLRRYRVWGALFGLYLPVTGTLLHAALDPSADGFWLRVARAQELPLFWILDSAPLVMALAGALAGAREDRRATAEAARRAIFTETSAALFQSSQQLLATVSAFGALTGQTASSVRETTNTLEQMAHNTTQAALTAETVVGVATSSQRFSRDGLRAVDTAIAEMLLLADHVRELSGRIEGLGERMRDILEVVTTVNAVSERSQELARRAAQELERHPGAGAFAGVVGQLRQHAEDAQGSAQAVKRILGETHRTMMGALTSAEQGIQRAERGADVARATGETIHLLAAALEDSSRAAREIAQGAQQQDQSVGQVLKAMNEIFLATEQTVAGTHEVEAGAHALHELAERLEQSVHG